ncbi:DUF3108 domain-containing protein [Photobacterium nomapromontoriensis]|uniref:DUF3108 domain-containing protein n=1 Tax=Photobacterium nomapromontoriensis TaxID=2910237 RepID=UPI003D0C698E
MQAVLSLLFLIYATLSTTAYASSDPDLGLNNCTKTFIYQLFFNNIKIGQLSRSLRWKNNHATILSSSKINVLATKTLFKQQSMIYWSPEQQSFVTKKFTRHVNGLITETTNATFTAEGKQSTVTTDNKKLSFTSTALPLLDIDAISSDIRLALIQGKKDFDYKLQGSDDVNHYYFKVIGKETINSNFGKVTAFKVEQIRKKDRKLVMWFSPDIDYQLVKATYKRNILDLKATLLNKQIICTVALNL